MFKPMKSYLRIRDELIEMVKIEEGFLILDVATWQGYTAIEIGKRYEKVRVIGVDISEKAIKKAKANVRKEMLKNVDLRVADVENLPFDDNRFDLIVCNMALGHFSNMPKAVSEMVRVAKIGGEIGISGWIPPAPMLAMIRFMTKVKLRGVLGKFVPLPKMRIESQNFTIEGMIKAIEKMIERGGAEILDTKLIDNNSFICIGKKK